MVWFFLFNFYLYNLQWSYWFSVALEVNICSILILHLCNFKCFECSCSRSDTLGLQHHVCWSLADSQASCLSMSGIKGCNVSACQTAAMKLNERQMLKGALFLENKGSDGNHTLDETIILPSVCCHSWHFEAKMGACAPLFNSFTSSIFLLSEGPPTFSFYLAITVISASVICSDMGVHMLVCACVCKRVCAAG